MPKGNKQAFLNSPMVDNTSIDKEENALLINHCLDIFHMKEPDLSNSKEVESAINYYFNSCLSKGLRPGNMGLYTALGLERREALNLLQGRIKKNASPESLAYIKRACKALSLYRESLGSAGKLNPATLIFWQKNYDGLEDIQRIDIDANNAPKADMTADEIEQKLLEDLPIDSDYKEVK